MLKKIFRLSSSKDISVTSLRGRSFFSPYFVVKFAAKAGITPRFAVIVSTKVSKRAVERNRIKRIIRETLRNSLATFRSGDYVIIVKRKASGQEAKDIKNNLEQLMITTRLKQRTEK